MVTNRYTSVLTIHAGEFLEETIEAIGMTIRGSYSDIFWFSLFCEIGDILLHPKREIFLEDGCVDVNLKKQEDEADRFAISMRSCFVVHDNPQEIEKVMGGH